MEHPYLWIEIKDYWKVKEMWNNTESKCLTFFWMEWLLKNSDYLDNEKWIQRIYNLSKK